MRQCRTPSLPSRLRHAQRAHREAFWTGSQTLKVCITYVIPIGMDVMHVKIPEERKAEIETLAEAQHYPSVSEYIREAVRDKIERDLPLSDEVQDRIDAIRERRAQDEDASVPMDEVREDLDL